MMDTNQQVVRGVTVDQDGAARSLADEAAAKSAGFSPAKPLYQVGTMVVDLGVKNAKASRQDFESKPFTDDACAELADKVAAEYREDHKVTVDTLALLPDGSLKTPWNGNLFMTERAFSSLCTFVTPGGGGYLAECPPDLRATNLNHWFPLATKEDKRAWNRAVKEWESKGSVGEPPAMIITPKEVTLRTRKHEAGSREVFACTGPRYGAFDIDQIAKQIAAGCPADSRCDLTYDGYRARFNVLFHSNIQPENYVAGEFFRGGLCITTADDGSGAIKVGIELERNLCLNLIVINHEKLLLGSRRHIGNTGNIAADVKAYVDLAMEKMGHFVAKWSEANAEDVLAKYADQGIDDIETLFKRLVQNRVVHVVGVKPDEMVQRLYRAWEQEPARTKAGILNAITRVAHTETWQSPWTELELEQGAGELLFVKQWNVTDPTAAGDFTL